MKMTSKWRWPRNEDDPKNEHDLKNVHNLKNEDEIKNITWKNCWWLLTLTGTATLLQNRKCYQLSKPEIEFDVMKEMYAALGMHTCSEKTTF